MKKWENPEVEILDVQETFNGPHITDYYDDTRVDHMGGYWIGGSSGPDTPPTLIVPTNK